MANDLRKKALLDQAKNKKLYDQNMATLGLGSVTPKVALVDKKANPVTPKKIVKKKTESLMDIIPAGETPGPSTDETDELLAKLQGDQDEPEAVHNPEEESQEPQREPANKAYNLHGMEDLASVGAGPLLALLGGASPAVFNMHMNKANQSAGYIGNDAKITKDKVTVLDDGKGNPVNALVKDSIGKQPYYQKKAGALGKSGKEFAPISLMNIKTGEVMPAVVKGDGFHDTETDEKFGKDWLPFKKDEMVRSRTVQGGYDSSRMNQYTKKLEHVQYKLGLGDLFGGVSKEEANSGIKQTEKAKAGVQKTVEAKVMAESALAELDRVEREPTPEGAARAFYMLVKATNGERVSDSDYANLRGSEFKSYVRQFEDWKDGKLTGTINPKAIQAFKQVARDIIAQKTKESQSIKKSYVNPGLLPQQGQDRLDNMVGTGKQQSEGNQDWRSKYKKLGK